jgi:cell shape-determining protein MreC
MGMGKNKTIQNAVDDLLSIATFAESGVIFFNSLSGLSSTSDLQTAIAMLVTALKENLAKLNPMLTDAVTNTEDAMAILNKATATLEETVQDYSNLQDQCIKICNEYAELLEEANEKLKERIELRKKAIAWKKRRRTA